MIGGFPHSFRLVPGGTAADAEGAVERKVRILFSKTWFPVQTDRLTVFGGQRATVNFTWFMILIISVKLSRRSVRLFTFPAAPLLLPVLCIENTSCR